MKKILVLIVIMLGCYSVHAQDTVKKNNYVKKGDVIEATLYFDSGEISQKGYYSLDGVVTGTWVSYNRNGDKTAKAQYDHGVKVGTWFFWSDNTLTEVDYKDSRITAINTWKNDGSRIVSNN